VKEYEMRMKAEMERTKNAKQGGKKRVLELEGIVRLVFYFALFLRR
jgi:hypothetical protein